MDAYFPRPVKSDEDDRDDDPVARRLKKYYKTVTTPSLSELVAKVEGVASKAKSATENVEVPEKAGAGKLKDYQVVGVRWLSERVSLPVELGSGALLADEMGLGKTLQAIQTISVTKTLPSCSKGPVLVISPLSVVQSWSDDLSHFAPHLKAVKVIGGREAQDEIYNKIAKEEKIRYGSSNTVPPFPSPCIRTGEPGTIEDLLRLDSIDVVITTPQVLMLDNFFFSRIYWRMMVFDEGHRLKNPNAKLYKTLLHDYMYVPQRILLTGTPLQNNPSELLALLGVVNPHFFQGAELIDASELSSSKGSSTKLLTAITDVFMLRRLKKVVLKDLPPLREVIIRTPLSPLQRRIYRAALMKDLGSVVANGTKTGLMNIAMELRKCCNHPYMFEGVEKEPFELGEHIVNNSAKLAYLDKILVQLKKEGHRVLIFSQFSHMLDILQDYLFYRDFACERLDGSVRGDERFEAVSKFQTDEDRFVFLLSTRAGGVGLTLTGADTVIFYDSDWNPQMDLQAQQRAHRIGQDRPVTVYRLICENTIEDAILLRAQRKLSLAQDVLRDDDGEKKGGVPGNAGQVRELIQFSAFAIKDDIAAKTNSPVKGDDGKPLMSKAELHKQHDEAWEKHLAATTAVDILGCGKRVNFTTEEASATLADDFHVFEGEDYKKKFEKAVEEGGALLTKKAAAAAAATVDSTRIRTRANRQEAGGDDDDDEDYLSHPPVIRRAATKASEVDRLKKLKTKWAKSLYESTSLPLEEETYAYIADAKDAVSGAPLFGRLAALITPGLAARKATALVATDDDDDASGDPPEVKPILHAAGDVTDPPPPLDDKERQIIVIPVNNSGSWGAGGFFKRLAGLVPEMPGQYEAAKENNDLRLGDAHLFPLKGRDPRILCLAVIQKSSTSTGRSGGDLDLKSLDLVLQKLAALKSFGGIHFSLHLPQLANGDRAMTYAAEKTVTKVLSANCNDASTITATIYYYRSGAGGGRGDRRGRDDPLHEVIDAVHDLPRSDLAT